MAPIGFEADVYVGRRADLEQLAHLIRAAREGSGSLLLVSGEAGMGKTRFAEEAARLGRAAGLAVGWGQCTDSEGAPPYLSSTGAPVEVGVVGVLIAALAAAFMFSARSAVLFEVGMIAFAFVSTAALVAPFVVFQNVVAPSLRASAASLANTVQRLIGFTLGPLAVGFVSDLAHRDLRLSLLLLTPTGLVLATACLAAALATVKRDVAAMEMGWALRETSTETVPATVPSVAEPLQAAARP